MRAGTMFGYLAYVDGRPAAWVNASRRATPRCSGGATADARTAAVACFAVAPPYRRHGLAQQLLARVMADAPAGAWTVEAYPPQGQRAGRRELPGRAAMYDAAGFAEVKVRPRHRRALPGPAVA